MGEVVSLVASATSIVLGVLAIWLSIVFYRLSADAAVRANKASDAMAANLDRLEKLFNSMYADTFGIMRETVGYMQRQLWPDTTGDNASEDRPLAIADVRMVEIQQDINEQVSAIVHRQEEADAKVSELEKAISSALRAARAVDDEANVDAVTKEILDLMRLRPGAMGYGTIVNYLVTSAGFSRTTVLVAVRRLVKAGRLRVERGETNTVQDRLVLSDDRSTSERPVPH
jgi:hypothetical protein